MDVKKHFSGVQKRKRKKIRNDFKRMKVSLTNWVLSYNKQNIADDSSDREEKTGEANCYGLSADASRPGQQISKQATICIDETI